MRRNVVITMLVGFALAALLTQDARAQMEKSGKYTGKYTFSANIFLNRELEKDHFFYLAENQGVFFNDAGSGFLHASSSLCTVLGEVTKDGFTGNGHCVLTDRGGDKAFLAWDCKPRSGGGCEGPFRWTGGTGQYKGMSGDNWFVAHPFIGGTTQAYVDWKGEWRLP